MWTVLLYWLRKTFGNSRLKAESFLNLWDYLFKFLTYHRRKIRMPIGKNNWDKETYIQEQVRQSLKKILTANVWNCQLHELIHRLLKLLANLTPIQDSFCVMRQCCLALTQPNGPKFVGWNSTGNLASTCKQIFKNLCSDQVIKKIWVYCQNRKFPKKFHQRFDEFFDARTALFVTKHE